MPVVVVAADANIIRGTGHEIFPRSVIVRRFVLKNDLLATSRQTDAAKAADQQQVEKHKTKESTTGFEGPKVHKIRSHLQ